MVSFPAAAPHAAAASAGLASALLCGVALGTLGWYPGFAAVVALARGRIGPPLPGALEIGIGCGLLGFGGLLGYRAVRDEGV